MFIIKNSFKLLYCALAFVLLAAIVAVFLGQSLNLTTGDSGNEKKLFSLEKTASGSIIINIAGTELTLNIATLRELGNTIKGYLGTIAIR